MVKRTPVKIHCSTLKVLVRERKRDRPFGGGKKEALARLVVEGLADG